MTWSAKRKWLAGISGSIILLGSVSTVIGSWTGWKRPWVLPDELQQVEQIAGSAFERSYKLRGEFLQQQQRYLDDRREELKERQKPVPRWVRERQQRLERIKCEHANELLPPHQRRPCP